MLMVCTADRDHRPPSTQGSLPRFLLRKWLRGRWVLVFSHPDDFAHYGFEADRWIARVSNALDSGSITALAFTTRTSGEDAGWIAAVGGCYISPRTLDSIVHFCRSERRFVMVLDGALQLRRTFLYSDADRVPSPIDLVSLAASCRLRA